MEYIIKINNRDYSEWKVCDTQDNDVELSGFSPITNKLFHNDIFSFSENQELTVVESPLKTKQVVPGILVLEGNKTFGNYKNKYFYRCIPNDKTLPIFIVPYEIKKIGFEKSQKNKYVLFTFSEWIDKHPVGKLIETIGDVDLPENIYEYQLQCYNLNVSLTNFNKKANSIIKQNVINNELFETFINTSKYSIQDRRSTYVFAIDPEGSTDFDDAFSITTNSEGQTVISIYIANVAVWLEYLCFWNELTSRVSTIYMPDKRRLLLPSILTDQIFTLKQKQDNITMYLDVTLDSNGMIIQGKTTYGNACINVKKNFVYEEDRLLKNEYYKKLLDVTHRLDNTIEESHSLVSYWMIHTNTYFAGLLKDKNIGIFRSSSLKDDLFVIPKDNVTNEEYNMLKNFKTVHCDYVNASDDLNHVVMGIDMYTHITSPIRRVVDIYNQLCIQYYYGFIDELSNDAISFLEHYGSLTGYINQQSKSIKKVQNSCNIIHMVMTNPNIFSTEYDVILFDCQQHKLGYEYNVYLPSLKIFSKVKTDKIYENYSKTKCQLYYFSSENQVNNKVKIQLL